MYPRQPFCKVASSIAIQMVSASGEVKAQNGTSTWNAVGLPYGSLTRAWSR
jgi:hypothetical protein